MTIWKQFLWKQAPQQGHTRRRCSANAVFLVKVPIKWAHLVQWECPGQKARQETPGAQEFLLQDFSETKVPQVPQVRSSMLFPSLSN